MARPAPLSLRAGLHPPPPSLLPAGWVDVWPALHPSPSEPGFTYDPRSNPMLQSHWPGSRLDRVLARLGGGRDRGSRADGQRGGGSSSGNGSGGSGGVFEAMSIEMVGTRPLPGAKYLGKKGAPLPVCVAIGLGGAGVRV